MQHSRQPGNNATTFDIRQFLESTWRDHILRVLEQVNQEFRETIKRELESMQHHFLQRSIAIATTPPTRRGEKRPIQPAMTSHAGLHGEVFRKETLERGAQRPVLVEGEPTLSSGLAQRHRDPINVLTSWWNWVKKTTVDLITVQVATVRHFGSKPWKVFSVKIVMAPSKSRIPGVFFKGTPRFARRLFPGGVHIAS